MPTRKRVVTSLAIEVGALENQIKDLHTTLTDHVAEEHKWLGKLDAVTTRLEALDSIKVNGNVGLEHGLRDIYKKTEQISAQVSDLHEVLRAQIDRRRVLDDLTKWMEHSTLGKWLTTKWAKTIWLIVLGILLWEHEKVTRIISDFLK